MNTVANSTTVTTTTAFRSLNEQDSAGSTLLMHAVKVRNIDALRVILNYSSHHQLSITTTLKNNSGKTVLDELFHLMNLLTAQYMEGQSEITEIAKLLFNSDLLICWALLYFHPQYVCLSTTRYDEYKTAFEAINWYYRKNFILFLARTNLLQGSQTVIITDALSGEDIVDCSTAEMVFSSLDINKIIVNYLFCNSP